MLSKPHRLTSDRDFKRVYRLGRSFFVKELGVKAAKNNLEVSRFGIVVGTKIHKKAVKRNLIKRRLRHIIQKNLPLIRTGFDVVILTRPEILGLKYKEMAERLETIFKKLSLYE